MNAITVQAENWPAPIEANPGVIRAAIYGSNTSDFFRFKIVRADGWEFWGLYRRKKGWNIRTGTTEPDRELSAVRAGSKYSGRSLNASFPKMFFNRFEHFSDLDVEKLALEFLRGASPPMSVQWVEMKA